MSVPGLQIFLWRKRRRLRLRLLETASTASMMLAWREFTGWLHFREELFQANVAVVVAGMEGALASVVGGLVSCPVIGVPTSIGYGASFGGLAALLSMLNSCASGVSVVNIDNGFGAGYQASLINKSGIRNQESGIKSSVGALSL